MHADLLNSWKEIASYLGRGVRTVQRWETELQLPVRRPHLRKRTGVTALKSEVDYWVRKTGRSTNNCEVSSRNVAHLRMNREEMLELTKQLRKQVDRTLGLLREAQELASRRAPGLKDKTADATSYSHQIH